MEKEKVREIIEAIMKRLSYTKSLEDVVEVYKRKYHPMPHWMKAVGGIESDKPEWVNKDYSIWDEILPSMYTMPEMVRICETVCPECGEKCIGLFFSSPAWTWDALCGRGGHMVICPSCPKMVTFGLTIMN